MVPDCRRRPALPGSRARTLCDHSLMLITSPCVVSLTWTLADAQGATLDELTDPVEFFYGGAEVPQFAAKQAFDGLPEGAVTKDMPPSLIYTITEIYPEHVVLDGNHPLAGMALRLAVQVKAVREATEDEIAAQSVDEGAVSILSPVPGSQHLH